MRIVTVCERCGEDVTEVGIWVVRSGIRAYCGACGYLSPPMRLIGAAEGDHGVVVDLRHPAVAAHASRARHAGGA